MIKVSKLLLVFVFVASIISSCKKDKTETDPKGQVEFTVSLSQLKSIIGIDADVIPSNLASVVVSVEDANGNVVKNSEKIELYNMNGNYISKPLALVAGSYNLTRF